MNNYDFENLNMVNLRDTLTQIFFGEVTEETKKYVVPLQGNWYNPSMTGNAGTWVGYVIDTMESSVSVVRDNNDNSKYLRDCRTSLHLCFIGAQAEEMAQSVLFWVARRDVQELMDQKYKANLNNNHIRIFTTPYAQEGANSTICWNVSVTITHNMLLAAKDKPPLTNVVLSGNLIMEDK